MDLRLNKLIQTAKFTGDTCMLDTYNQAVHEDVSCTIRTNINTANHHFIFEKMSEIKYIGQISSSQNSRVIDPEGISYAVTNGHKDGEPKIIEPNILTPKRTDFGKQVRKQYENKEINMSRHDMTQLEPRQDGVSNTITSIQKDNLLADPIIIDDYNQRVPQDQDVIGTVTTQFGNPAPRHGYKIEEPLRIPQATKQGYIEVPQGEVFDMSYPESTTRRGRVQEGGQVSPTLMTGGEAPCYYEGIKRGEEWKSVIENKQMNPFRGSVEDIAPCITSACGAGGGMTPMLSDADVETTKTEEFIEQVRGHRELNYRIRKLTTRECFRLMGVTEANIDKIQASGVSQSQQYKMAGNSIVVDVLEHIFRKMFVDTGQESQQLSLF